MAALQPMPSISINQAELARFGQKWLSNGGKLSRTPPLSSLDLGKLIDMAVGQSLSAMLGNVPIVTTGLSNLLPPQGDCVEVGPVNIVGGVRPQDFDAAYRPDGPRFVFDSKTLNDSDSLGKNSFNMINDLATEASSVHIRFPYALVAFIIALPRPCVTERLSVATARLQTLERMTGRLGADEPMHLAEAISVMVWDPETGEIDATTPAPDSPLRIEKFSTQVEHVYRSRYQGQPPH